MTTLTFDVLGHPTPWGRPRATVRNGKAAMFSPSSNNTAKKIIGAAALTAARMGGVTLPLAGEIELSCQFYGRGPVPDLDNLAKQVQDALNGVAFVDDRQITRLRARRYWGVADVPSKADERTVIEIRETK